MELTITRTGTTLKLVGSIDLVSRQSLVDAGREVLDGGDSITLDLSGVEFIDSVGIGAIVELSKASEALARPFVVAELSPRARRVLEVTGLSDAWVSPDRTAAGVDG
ncbi:STAS domain-containing protein [Nocardioides terrae]|uniref:STAS domain-containing protein n=1 Tax=Nocardioides terrae TaxID=574651 RepID=A0A1I1L6J4_9ACTN|nr:STAS domain-containing protein [Nocardioides terrae]SFC68575.1 STAS domain-containing protein [Nocardioides terrae]